MKLYRRPPEPSDFREKVRRAREKAERLIETQLRTAGAKKSAAKAGAKKAAGKAAAGKKKEKVFQDVWKEFKAVFAYAQFDKCGFCESNILKTGRGDVEHYRPKSEVSALPDPDQRGVWQEAAAAVTGRRPKVLCALGYYWLAYNWSNYLLACAICNQNFKGSIFPVGDDPRALPPSKDAPDEDALLLNPFDGKEPARHLHLRPDGFILAKSSYGRATIDTCGLYRDPLIASRRAVALRVYDLARDLRRPAARREDPQVLRSCYDYGRDDAEHCGMARAIFEEVGGVDWEELVKRRAKELSLQIKSARGPERRHELDEQMERMGRERYEHSAEVRRIFERTCRTTWEKLVLRLAAQMARNFLADRPLWENDREYELVLKKNFYLLARDNPAYAAGIREAYERHSGMDWPELKALVEARVEMLWKLDDVTHPPAPAPPAGRRRRPARKGTL